MRMSKLLLVLALATVYAMTATGQEVDRPELAVGKVTAPVVLDGLLDDTDWLSAPATDNLRTTEPVEGAVPTGRTVVRVLAHEKYLVIGVECHYADPSDIVSFSKIRDTDLKEEDHVKIVIDPFLDGQSGYIFAVNANGARYDALVANRGESENKDWDEIWEAVIARQQYGWSVEIQIPIQSLNFKKGLDRWAFNIERRIQVNQETMRWANPKIDQWFIQTSRAGFITDIPVFDFGIGLSIQPSLVLDVSTSAGAATTTKLEPSLDVGQRIGPNIQATLTINTDFAETEVDTRQTNLTRFPLFFPEKRAFFLEGADIFEFGFGLSRQVQPFFSRRIGLYEGEQIRIIAGGKVNGRIGKTSFGGLTMRTASHDGEDFSLPASTMGVFRVKQNVLASSSVGVFGTFGDPEGRSGSWLGGADFTYQTTELWGDKNFLVGLWGLATDREDLGGKQYSYGIKIDYPNDLWDVAASYLKIDDQFDPSLGFVPRKGIHYSRLGATYGPRPEWKWLRQMRNQLFMTFYHDLKGKWESYSIFTAPINWRFESGDRFEFNFNPKGERLVEDFEIADSVVIPPGTYEYIRWRLEFEFAAKRKLGGQATWWFGSFFNGTLHQLQGRARWSPSPLLTFEFEGNHNIGRLPYGNFEQTVLGLRLRLNITPDLQINSFLQYDTVSDEFGINSRLHWIFHPKGDFFIVYNHNTFYGFTRAEFLSNQFLVKIRYNFRM